LAGAIILGEWSGELAIEITGLLKIIFSMGGETHLLMFWISQKGLETLFWVFSTSTSFLRNI
jgi:hypothetical protein